MAIKYWFGEELRNAGVRTNGLVWSDDSLGFQDVPTSWTQEEKDAVNAVLAAHNPDVEPPEPENKKDERRLRKIIKWLAQKEGKTVAEIRAELDAL